MNEANKRKTENKRHQHQECVQKVKERKMGYMFEHMEKMNIQEERRKTAKAEKWAQEAEQKAQEAEQKAEEAEQKAEESEHITIKSIVSVCRKHGISKEEAISEVMDNCELDKETAEEKVNQQW